MTENFKATWLYVKRHKKTGLKYFGKTTRDPYKYSGSGKYWLRHLRIHGNEVETTFARLFDCPVELYEFAHAFSRENNISTSDLWANLINENGFDGAPVGHEPHKFTDDQRSKISASSKTRWESDGYREKVVESQKKSWTDQRRKNNSTIMKSAWTEDRKKKHSEFVSNQKHTEEQLLKMRKPKPDGFGAKVSNALKGVKKSESHCKAISEAAKRRYAMYRSQKELSNAFLLKEA